MNTKKSQNHRKPQSPIYFQNMFLHDLKNYSIEKFWLYYFKTLTACLQSLPPSILVGLACLYLHVKSLRRNCRQAEKFRNERICNKIRINIQHAVLFFIFFFRFETQFLIQLIFFILLIFVSENRFFKPIIDFLYQARNYNCLYQTCSLLSKNIFFDIQNYFYVKMLNT